LGEISNLRFFSIVIKSLTLGDFQNVCVKRQLIACGRTGGMVSRSAIGSLRGDGGCAGYGSGR